MSNLPVLHIDLNAIAHNYQLCKDYAPSAQTAAVVKNDAYGLGAVQVAQKLYTQQCRHFFVAYASEGAAIRPHLPEAQIYILNGFTSDDCGLIKEFHLTPVLSSVEQINDWHAAKITHIKPALQVESGLHRLGVTYAQAEALSQNQRDNFGLILSHLASADEPQNPFNEEQRTALIGYKKLFPKAKFSLAASDGLGLGADFHFDIVRAGAFMYGLKTCPALNAGQQNVLCAEVSVLQDKELQIGDTLGYNQTFKAARETYAMALSVGYGDGFMRTLSNKGSVFFKTPDGWLKAPVIGRVSMDIIMCDVTDLPDFVRKAKTAFILNDVYTADDMGKDAGTIGYEILSSLFHTPRWQKKYIEK